MDPEIDQDFLRAVPIFSDLEEGHLATLASAARPVLVPAGERVFSAGDPGDALYLVRSGRIEVVAEDGAIMRELSHGNVLGELALLTGSARSATARARRDSELLRIGREEFLGLLQESTGFALALTRALGAQLQASRGIAATTRSRPNVITVVELSAGGGGEEFTAGLLEELSRLGRPARVPERPGEEPDETHAAAALDAAERAHDQVVLIAGPLDGGAWTEFCLRQADRVLALADAAQPPPRTGTQPGWDLVVRADAGVGERLRRWISAVAPRTVHRLGREGADGVDRLARRLTGRSLGLVLSGGGARGFAHLGVLEELDAAGVVVDRVAGCSMGAYVGAHYALGRSPDEIARRCRTEFVQDNPMGDYTLPVVAMVRGHKGERMLRRSFGDAFIEELERDYFCVSCDMLAAELVEHRSGELFRAVGASMCLPGVAPPVAMDGRLLLDGGVFNNLPVEQMAASGEGPVLAVDVTARFEAPVARSHFRRPRAEGALSALHRTITGVDEPRPRLQETIIRSIVLGSIDTAEAAARFATWTIEPRVEHFGMLAFDRLEEIRETGREAARELLEQARLPGMAGA